MDQAAQRGTVGLGQAQIFLEGAVLRLAAGRIKPQHVAEEFQRLGRDAGEQPEGFVGQRALRDRAGTELGPQFLSPLVCLARRLERPKYLRSPSTTTSTVYLPKRDSGA